MWRKLLELGGDFIESQTDFLGEDDERNPAEYCPMIAALSATAAFRGNETPLLIEAEG